MILPFPPALRSFASNAQQSLPKSVSGMGLFLRLAAALRSKAGAVVAGTPDWISNQIFSILKNAHNSEFKPTTSREPIKRLTQQHMEQHGTLNVVRRDPPLFKVRQSEEWTFCFLRSLFHLKEEKRLFHTLWCGAKALLGSWQTPRLLPKLKVCCNTFFFSPLFPSWRSVKEAALPIWEVVCVSRSRLRLQGVFRASCDAACLHFSATAICFASWIQPVYCSLLTDC